MYGVLVYHNGRLVCQGRDYDRAWRPIGNGAGTVFVPKFKRALAPGDVVQVLEYVAGKLAARDVYVAEPDGVLSPDLELARA